MLQIPLDRLPLADVERHAVLRDYFCDKDACAIRRGDFWNLSLYWPADSDRHVDPQLADGLRWWGGDVAHESMVFAARREGRVLTCLYDTLTLQSWSQWLASGGKEFLPTLIVLHVDDHRDLGSPRLFHNESGVRDAITGSHVSMLDPASVSAAISSGAIGMGSFLTPFLHAFSGVEVRHLCQPPKATETCDFSIELRGQNDTLIDPSQLRPVIGLEPRRHGLGPGTYRLTPDVDAWLEDLPEHPTLLHIDMDYFNNRYDGDSCWQDRAERLDPMFSAVAERIQVVGEALRKRDIMNQIKDAVVAYSPGFFPAEFWEEADALLRQILVDLYAK